MSLTVRDFPFYISTSFNADTIFPWISMANVNQGSFSISWTGTWDGSLFIEGANGGQYMVPLSNFDTDTTHVLLTLAITAGVQPNVQSPTKWLAELLPTCVKGVRVRLQVTSGSGTLKAHFYSKSTG